MKRPKRLSEATEHRIALLHAELRQREAAWSEALRRAFPRRGEAWTREDDRILARIMSEGGTSRAGRAVARLRAARELGRTTAAIDARWRLHAFARSRRRSRV